MAQKDQEFFEKWVNEKWLIRILYLVGAGIIFIVKWNLVYSTLTIWQALISTVVDVIKSFLLGFLAGALALPVMFFSTNLGAAAYSFLSNQPGKYNYPIKLESINDDFQENFIQLVFLLTFVIALIFSPTPVFLNP